MNYFIQIVLDSNLDDNSSAALSITSTHARLVVSSRDSFKGGPTQTGSVLNIRGNITGIAILHLGSRHMSECGIYQVN
jgi:hypothetical protein